MEKYSLVEKRMEHRFRRRNEGKFSLKRARATLYCEKNLL
jgi:hypothetical protein